MWSLLRCSRTDRAVSLAGPPSPPQVVHTLLSENRNPVLQFFSRTDRAETRHGPESPRCPVRKGLCAEKLNGRRKFAFSHQTLTLVEVKSKAYVETGRIEKVHELRNTGARSQKGWLDRNMPVARGRMYIRTPGEIICCDIKDRSAANQDLYRDKGYIAHFATVLGSDVKDAGVIGTKQGDAAADSRDGRRELWP
jgi:hypothetical protein